MTSMSLLWALLPAVSLSALVAFLAARRQRSQRLFLTDQFQTRAAKDAEKMSGLKAQVQALNDELKNQRATVARLTALSKTASSASPAAAPVQTPAPAATSTSLMDEPFAARRPRVRESLGFEDTQILG